MRQVGRQESRRGAQRALAGAAILVAACSAGWHLFAGSGGEEAEGAGKRPLTNRVQAARPTGSASGSDLDPDSMSKEFASQEIVGAPAGAPAQQVATEASQSGLLSQLLALRPGSAYALLHEIASDAERRRSEHVGLLEVVRDSRVHGQLRGVALLALAESGDLEPAREFLGHGQPVELQRAAIEVLRRCGSEQEWGRLSGIAQSTHDEEVRADALRALAQVSEAEAVPYLAEAAGAGSARSVRIAAVDLLSRSRDPRALAVATALRPAWGDEEEAAAQARALHALRDFGRLAASAALEKLSSHADLSDEARRNIAGLAD